MRKRENADKTKPGITIVNPGIPEPERNRPICFHCIYCGCDFTVSENECRHYNSYQWGKNYDFVIYSHDCPNCGTGCDALSKIVGGEFPHNEILFAQKKEVIE